MQWLDAGHGEEGSRGGEQLPGSREQTPAATSTELEHSRAQSSGGICQVNWKLLSTQ